ncbi:MAG TPA: CCA tRNA nucleotidyltransferase, partial [Alphaproteobacteria bacterium]|nr:CCA tRNA nucleotidyltransferase [Alphaproteobacteria bacterium]
GAADALAGIVRFVGEPIARLEEDVLRLLRFFRFYAHYGRGDADLAALAACAEMAPQLVRLSGERVWIELRKLLAAPDPLPAWELMAEHGALPFLLPAPLDGGARLAELLEVERELGDADPLLRLAALLEGGEAEALAAADRLRLSNAERDRLVALRTLPADFALPLDRRAARGFLHRLGPELFTDAVILRAARAPDTPVAELFEIAREGVPDFPLAGRDLLGLGLAPGPAVGRLLAALQEGWAGADFRPDRAALLAEARRRIAAGGI